MTEQNLTAFSEKLYVPSSERKLLKKPWHQSWDKEFSTDTFVSEFLSCPLVLCYKESLIIVRNSRPTVTKKNRNLQRKGEGFDRRIFRIVPSLHVRFSQFGEDFLLLSNLLPPVEYLQVCRKNSKGTFSLSVAVCSFPRPFDSQTLRSASDLLRHYDSAELELSQPLKPVFFSKETSIDRGSLPQLPSTCS